MNVVVVESPTKAKTINKYLGPDYTVLSSYGHVRDLPEKDGSVLPDEDFRIIYDVLDDKKRRIDEIARAMKGAERLYLATDPDREGEAISWHVLAALAEKGATRGVDVKRVVFHEVTRRAVLEAMAHPRDLDEHLIDAYQARRALDYLVGFTLSPVLWRKLRGSRSAGRVQSVALRLICEREAEIEAFRSEEYWTIEAQLRTPKGDSFTTRLVSLDGKRLQKLSLTSEADAKRAVAMIEERDLAVASVERKQVTRNPAPPFSTSTLQQEAARKLGFSADRTMRTAQRLFEGIELGGETVGLITYMRTDSVQLSNDALAACRGVIGERYGRDYLPEQPRRFKSRTKNAQEAHEAIRPTDPARLPGEVGRFLDDDQRRLYELIWQRTLASQMAAAIMDRVTAEIGSRDDRVGLRATGSTIAFDGFLRLYQEGRDDPSKDEDEEGRLLPAMAKGDALGKDSVTPSQHFTEPPPRYTEASLVKRLEELGIGRPSTYASIISVLQDRNYVRLESKRFVPEDRGRMVNAFLVAFFDRYVQPAFTADLEGRLDGVAAGELFWKDLLRDFWGPFREQVDEVKERRVAEIIDALNEALAPSLFPAQEDGSDPRRCPGCESGTLSLKFGRYGAFIGCSNYPECRFTRKLGEGANGGDGGGEARERLLGVDPETREEVWLRSGRFGPYLQKGTGEHIKRSSLPPGVEQDDLDLDKALALLALPREVGIHPETGKPVQAGINRYGPYIHHDGRFVRLGPDEDVLAIGMNRALSLLAEAGRGRAGPELLRELGEHPGDGHKVVVLKGRFGPYVKHGRTNASLPKGKSVDQLTLEEAVAMIAAKSGKGGKARPAAKRAKAGATKTGAATRKASTRAAPAAKPASSRKPARTKG
jgi:DNA topoisomerase I